MNIHRAALPPGFRRLRAPIAIGDALATMAIILISALAAITTEPQLGEAGGALIFVLGITLAGAFCGLVAALITALVAFLIYNFYLAEPVLIFRISTGRDIAPLIMFNLCAVVAGVLAGRLKDRAQAADLSNLHLTSLLDVSEALQSAIRIEDIAIALRSTAPARLGMTLRLFRARDDALSPVTPAEEDPRWQHIADRTWRQTRASIDDAAFVAYRLEGSEEPIGVLIAAGGDVQPIDRAFTTALANLTALAFERALLSERVADSRAVMRTEELQTALLSSVSHDFRTPLTAISASASSLIDYRDQLDPPTSIRLLHGIVEECDRLNRFTANLLEMSRLEAGQPQIRRQILSVSDVVGAASLRLRVRTGNRRIARTTIGGELLVDADAALFELALINIIDNAITYSDDGSLIEIECRQEGRHCRISIADEGIGIPTADLERVFDRFVRVARPEASPRGSGLGLAIARGFVEALDGSIVAATPGIGERGARIVIRLPLAEETL